jgi:outer membrane protein TolC
MTLRALSLAFIAALTFSSARATPVEERVTSNPVKLSLEQAIQYALRHNAAIKNARIDVALQKQKNREITGIALPQVNGRNEFQFNIDPLVAFFPARFTNPTAPADAFAPVPIAANFTNTASLTGSQILFDGSVLVALQARNTIIELTQLGVRASEQDVRYNVTRAYYGLVVARQQFNTLQKSLATFRDVLRDLTILRQQGFVEKIEVDRTQVQVNNLATDSLRTANLIALSEQLLKYNMTLPLEQQIELTDTSIADVLSNSAGMLEGATDYNNRVDYALTQTQLRLNEFDVKRYRYKALPTLAAFSTAAYTYANNEFRKVTRVNNYIGYSLVGLRLDVPIFSGFQRKAQLEQAYLNVEKTRNNLQQLRLSIDLQSEQARTVLRNSLLALQNNERNIDLANSVLTLARKKYKAGVGSNLEVTQAQTELLQAQNRLFAAQLDVINATTDLQRAQGLFR